MDLGDGYDVPACYLLLRSFLQRKQMPSHPVIRQPNQYIDASYGDDLKQGRASKQMQGESGHVDLTVIAKPRRFHSFYRLVWSARGVNQNRCAQAGREEQASHERRSIK
jgi:hypothetical protein